MKARLALALVLCFAAAAFFSPVKGEEEDATVQLKGDEERLTEDNVESLSRELKEVEGSSDADEDTVDGTGTDLDQDPSDGMLRDLKGYSGYYKPHYYRPHYYRPYYYRPYYKRHSSHGRRLAGSYGHYHKYKYPYYKYSYHKKPYYYYKRHGL